MTEPKKKSLARRIARKWLWWPYQFMTRSFFEPFGFVNKFRGAPYFVRNLAKYRRGNPKPSFRFRLRDLWYRSYDRFSDAGALTAHYFWQDLWAATKLADDGVKQHVDVGSRLDGFVAHVLPFCNLTYVDIRPLALDWPHFTFRQGSILEMPFEDGTVSSLSSLHVIEHVGLGRYGDPVDPDGSWKAARELIRVLAPGGRLLLGVPTGRDGVYFDAHRVFAPETILEMFSELDLAEFSLITDRNELVRSASIDLARGSEYGCGLFEFRKRG